MEAVARGIAPWTPGRPRPDQPARAVPPDRRIVAAALGLDAVEDPAFAPAWSSTTSRTPCCPHPGADPVLVCGHHPDLSAGRRRAHRRRRRRLPQGDPRRARRRGRRPGAAACAPSTRPRPARALAGPRVRRRGEDDPAPAHLDDDGARAPRRRAQRSTAFAPSCWGAAHPWPRRRPPVAAAAPPPPRTVSPAASQTASSA